MDRYDVFQHFGTRATQIASVYATNAVDALGVVASDSARIVSCRWVLYPDIMVSSVRERNETPEGIVYTIRILQARKWDQANEGSTP